MATGAIPVKAPLAVPPRHGLLVSLPTETLSQALGTEGITYVPEACNQAGGASDMCDPGEFTYQVYPDAVEWRPYVLSVTEKCSTFSGTSENEARVRRLMQVDTERQLGDELWNGTFASSATMPDGNPYPNMWLANVASDDLTEPDTSKPPLNALTCLDEYLCDNNSGQPGVIHAPCDVLGYWKSLMVLEVEKTENGWRYYSPLGNLVIPSPGYDGSSPSGQPASTAGTWAYATDTPRIFLGPIQVSEIPTSIDRANNTIEMVAQRAALAEWQLCRHAAVRTSIVPCGEGGS